MHLPYIARTHLRLPTPFAIQQIRNNWIWFRHFGSKDGFRARLFTGRWIGHDEYVLLTPKLALESNVLGPAFAVAIKRLDDAAKEEFERLRDSKAVPTTRTRAASKSVVGSGVSLSRKSVKLSTVDIGISISAKKSFTSKVNPVHSAIDSLAPGVTMELENELQLRKEYLVERFLTALKAQEEKDGNIVAMTIGEGQQEQYVVADSVDYKELVRTQRYFAPLFNQFSPLGSFASLLKYRAKRTHKVLDDDPFFDGMNMSLTRLER